MTTTSGPAAGRATVRHWGRRRWLAALGGSLSAALVLGLPTDLIPNPVFGRQVQAPGWAWPTLLVTAVLSGLLLATYVREPGEETADPLADPAGRRGLAGGVLTFFAVGCPVCNKVVLLALGYTGALRWFEPVQPVLGVAAIGLLAWALWLRLRAEASCPLPSGPGEGRPVG